MTVYWLIWDAAAHWVVDRLDRQGALPAVRRLREQGCTAAARPPRPNCQTPPSLATLFTGTWPSEHAVTGFDVPGAGGQGPAGSLPGFHPSFPAVDPVWRTLGRAGRRSAFVHVPWVFDADGGLPPYVDAAVEAYSRRLARPGALPVDDRRVRTWDLGGHPLTVRTSSGDHLSVTVGDRTHRLHQHDEWLPVPLASGADAPGTWLRHLRTDGRSLLLHTGAWDLRTAGADRELTDRLRTTAPPITAPPTPTGAHVFAGESVGALYRDGTLGPRLAEGGDGTAEDLLLSSARCVARSFAAAATTVIRHHTADLVVIYLPMTDDIGHELLGWCDPCSAAHRPDIAERLWTHVRTCYQWADDVLALALDHAAADDTVLLTADHGMVGSSHQLHLNDVLIQAGLATAAPDGHVDCARSTVYYHPANNGSLWHACAPAPAAPAPVTPDEPAVTATPAAPAHAAAMRRAMTALVATTHPGTGRSVVRGFTDDRGEPLSVPALDAPPPVVHVVLHDDYQPTSRLSGGGEPLQPLAKTAAHVVNTGSPRLHAIFAAAGPGIAPGTRLGTVDNTLPASLVLARAGSGTTTDARPPLQGSTT